MIVALTGATGNMGKETLKKLLQINEIDKVKILVLEDDKRQNELLKYNKKDKSRIEIIRGNIASNEACVKLCKDASYVINMAAVIPPHSDKYPLKAIECNQIGVEVLVNVIENTKPQPKFIHISTVALYGNRNSNHPWGRVGDPLLVSAFDIYAITKLRGEFCVLESNIDNFVILRQTAMLHKRMLKDNMSDGLMFHTCFNAPLEWVTANDSGTLIANIIKKDLVEDLSKTFWKKVFNIAGGNVNCVTGYNTLDDGFKLIGGSCKDFFEPNYNATRNFHGLWFYDGNKLEEMFNYQSESTTDFWLQLKKENWYFKLGKIVPKRLIKKFVIKRLFKNYNSPKYWLKHDDIARIYAYYGGLDNYNNIKASWNDFSLLIENKDEQGNAIDYLKLKDKNNAKLIDFGIDIDKDNFTIEEIQKYVSMHGGKLISTTVNSMYDKLTFEDMDGNRFIARPYTIIKAGHWYHQGYKDNVWDFDRLAKIDKIYAQIWYDSHKTDEDKFYYYDKDFKAHMVDL